MGDVARRWLILPAVLLAASLAAQDAAPAEPIVLWGDFTVATTKAEAKALRAALPKGRVEIIPGCSVTLTYRPIKATVVTVLMLGRDGDSDCYGRLLAKYRAELGEPEVGSATFGSELAFGDGAILDTRSEGRMLVWREGEKKTKLVKAPGDGYNLIYTVRDDKYIH
jgi:hypothetical protein